MGRHRSLILTHSILQLFYLHCDLTLFAVIQNTFFLMKTLPSGKWGSSLPITAVIYSGIQHKPSPETCSGLEGEVQRTTLECQLVFRFKLTKLQWWDSPKSKQSKNFVYQQFSASLYLFSCYCCASLLRAFFFLIPKYSYCILRLLFLHFVLQANDLSTNIKLLVLLVAYFQIIDCGVR